ncbi:MAG TPA: type IV pilus modification protein PilV [Longimicrobium sp.]|nr:type IV pilus modification protein PilV [Longimicrobium sp.]
MTTDPAPRGDAGFSLIEVLIAMIILSVGLLALESLGIGAARTVYRAKVQSTYAATATDLMERTLVRIAQTPATAIADTSYTGTSGERVSRTAAFSSITGTTRGGVAGTTLSSWTVTVKVLPPTTLGVLAASDSVKVVSNVIQ